MLAVTLLTALASCSPHSSEPAPADAPPSLPKRAPSASALLILRDTSGSALLSNDDPRAAVHTAMSNVEAQLRSPAFAARVVSMLDDPSWLGTDPAATIEEAIVVEPRKDSRLFEIGVVLADRGEAMRLCQAVLAAYTQRPSTEPFSHEPSSHESVSVLEGCMTSRKR